MRARRFAGLVVLALLTGCGDSGSTPGAGGSSTASTGGSSAGSAGGNGGAGSGGAGAGGGGNAAGAAGVSGSRNSGGSAGGGRAGSASGTAGTLGAAAGEGGEGGDSGAPSLGCPKLAEPSGNVIEVGPDEADDLPGIVRNAPAGTTILLADGTYRMTGGGEAERRIQIVTDDITLRGASGNRDSVLIDGEYETEEMITVSASNVTLAHLSVMRAVHHPIHVTGGPGGDTRGVTLYDLHVSDGGEQFVKINPSGATPNTYTDDGLVACSLFELTANGRPHVVPDPGGCYTGGIDGHQARGWVVRDNTFRGIYCENGGLAEHAVHFWTASRDTLVERNTIIDCARGIGFGLGDGGGNDPDRAYDDDPYPGLGYVGHYDGIIRNNVLSISPGLEFFDTGIELEQAHGTRVLHNTVIHPETAFASISHRFSNTAVTLENNLVRSIRERDGSTATGDGNLEGARDDLFVDAARHDLHLAPTATDAVDHGSELPDVTDDIDGDERSDGAPDLGADERK